MNLYWFTAVPYYNVGCFDSFDPFIVIAFSLEFYDIPGFAEFFYCSIFAGSFDPDAVFYHAV